MHSTEYRYGNAMSDGYTVAHLLPRETTTQRVVSAEIHATPDADEVDEHLDLFGNRVVRLGVHHPHDHLGVISRCIVEVDDLVGQAPCWGSALTWDDAVLATRALRGPRAIDVGAMTAATASTPAIAEVRAMADGIFLPGRPLIDVISDLCHRIHVDFRFDPAVSDVTTPLDEVIAARGGVCQDFAHLLLAVARSVGLAARYVSGYLETDPPPDAEKMIGADASHAWCSIWSPEVGWFDVDPTNDQIPPQRHVTIGWGRDYSDIAPVRGVVIGPTTTQVLDVSVDVMRLGDPPPD